MKTRSLVSVLAIAFSLLLILSEGALAATKSDRALALATSGCMGGMLNTPFNNSQYSFMFVSTAIASQWSDNTNTEKNQIHHNQFSEGLNAAAMLDSKWSRIANSYSQVYSAAGAKISRGDSLGKVQTDLMRQFEGVINSNCKIASILASSKAKKAKKSLSGWIIENSGTLLPTLDLR